MRLVAANFCSAFFRMAYLTTKGKNFKEFQKLKKLKIKPIKLPSLFFFLQRGSQQEVSKD